MKKERSLCAIGNVEGQRRKINGIGIRTHHSYWGWGKETNQGFLPDETRCYGCDRKCRLNENFVHKAD